MSNQRTTPATSRHVCPGYADTGCIDPDCDRRDRSKYPDQPTETSAR